MNHSLVDGGGVADFSIMTRNQMIEVLIEDIRRDAENMHSNGELIDHYTRVAIRSVVSGDSSDEDVEQALIDRGLGHEPPVTYSFSVGDRVFWKDPCEGSGSVLVAIIAPMTVEGDHGARLALVCTGVVMLLIRRPLLAIASGILAAGLSRAFW